MGSGPEAEQGTEGGFPVSWEMTGITGLWDERHGIIPVSQMCFSSLFILRKKAGYGLGNPAGAVPRVEDLTSELKLHLSDCFTNHQNLKKCAWY